ncbi:unnamed protein product [Hymenolepis diminuta]|uniref:DUF4801 domain-containing protein n=1 Tax=Hymenolepis diminuta TaxID=6216 RepID=A0A0R3SEN7_HYMDI|nr:unnamed protein product [Hymenolepis diminuta]
MFQKKGKTAENITKENSPKSSLRGLSSDAKSDRSVPTVNSLAKPVENGVEKDKAMLDKRTPPTSPQTEGNQLFYQSMIDRIDKRPTIDKISSMKEKYPPSVYEEETSLSLLQAPSAITCHRVSLHGPTVQQNSMEQKVSNGISNGSVDGSNSCKKLTASPLYREKRQDTPHPVSWLCFIVKGLKKPIGAPTVQSDTDDVKDPAFDGVQAKMHSSTSLSSGKKGRPTIQSHRCRLLGGGPMREPDTTKDEIAVTELSPQKCSPTQSLKGVEVASDKTSSQSSKSSNSSITNNLPDCLKPFAGEIAEILSQPLELPTPPSSPRFVKKVPISEATVKETPDPDDCSDVERRSKGNTTDSDESKSQPGEELNDDGSSESKNSESSRKPSKESNGSSGQSRSKSGTNKQKHSKMLREMAKLSLEEDDKDVFQLQSSPAAKEPPDEIINEVSEYMKKTAYKISSRVRTPFTNIQRDAKISPTAKSQKLARETVRKLGLHRFNYRNPVKKPTSPFSSEISKVRLVHFFQILNSFLIFHLCSRMETFSVSDVDKDVSP